MAFQYIERFRSKTPKSLLIYVLGGYIILQFVWWAYMLVDLNAEIYHLKLAMLLSSETPSVESQLLKLELDEKLSIKIWMVLGEGSVFLVLLALGFRAVRRSITKELNLAEQQNNFLLSITHELKSPLAAIKLQLQTLAIRKLKDEQRNQLYSRALKDTDRLEKLVENLLMVNKAESGKMPIVKQKVDVSKLVYDLAEHAYKEQLDSKLLELSIVEGVCVNGDVMALQSIVSNLLDNAFKYASNSKVQLSVVQKTNVEITVSDGGPGISNSDKQRIFERFYRLGSENTRTTKGTGIGLYLVKILVRMHEGQISVSDVLPNGTCFTVTLPQVGN
ncbi:sensor histidine kinase [Bacteroidota bacterium]